MSADIHKERFFRVPEHDRFNPNDVEIGTHAIQAFTNWFPNVPIDEVFTLIRSKLQDENFAGGYTGKEAEAVSGYCQYYRDSERPSIVYVIGRELGHGGVKKYFLKSVVNKAEVSEKKLRRRSR